MTSQDDDQAARGDDGVRGVECPDTPSYNKVSSGPVLAETKAQKYMYVGTPEGRIWTVERESGHVVSAFGRHGTMVGEFYVHDLAINSTGDLFIAEEAGRRTQRFKAVGKD